MSVIVDQFSRMISGYEAGAAGLWDEIAESGFLDLLLAEDQGGAGMALGEAFPIALLLGQRGIDLPVVETMVARALLGSAAPAGMVVLCDATPWPQDVMRAARVLSSTADGLVAMDSEAAIPTASARLRAIAAALRAASMAGTMQAVADLTIAYSLARQQFGREIARFQAVQQQLAVMAEETLAASMAASAAFHAGLDRFSEDRAATAKMRACLAADTVMAISHAVHGAIGVSHEYELGRHSARLRVWSAAYGGRSYWEARLGAAVLRRRGGFLDAIRISTQGVQAAERPE